MVWTNPSPPPTPVAVNCDVGITRQLRRVGRSSYSRPASGFLVRQSKGTLHPGTIQTVTAAVEEEVQENTAESAPTSASFPLWLCSVAHNHPQATSHRAALMPCAFPHLGQLSPMWNILHPVYSGMPLFRGLQYTVSRGKFLLLRICHLPPLENC